MSKFKVGDKVIFKSQPPTAPEFWGRKGIISHLEWNDGILIYPCIVKFNNKELINCCSLDELTLDNTDIIKSLLGIE